MRCARFSSLTGVAGSRTARAAAATLALLAVFGVWAGPADRPSAAGVPQSASRAANPNDYFKVLAGQSRRGTYPRYFHGEQAYWTVAGAANDTREALLGMDGALEVNPGGFSIEPFLFADGKLLTWADVHSGQELEQGNLPVPAVTWRYGPLSLKVTAFASLGRGRSTLFARYRIQNQGHEPQRIRLFLALRPFQVLPPWQDLNLAGGVAPIRRLAFDGSAVTVNDRHLVIPLTRPQGFGAARLERGSIADLLAAGRLPERQDIVDPVGYASGALSYALELPPNAAREIFLAMPPSGALLPSGSFPPTDGSRVGAERFQAAMHDWSGLGPRLVFRAPAEVAERLSSLRTALAHILINADGPALQPGSRTYARTWVRDGAIISSALLQMGHPEEVRRFLKWYATFQSPDGRIPCCVDGRGADPVAENDSHGEFLYAVAEYYRHTRDLRLVRALWPNVRQAVNYLESLRAQRMTDTYRRADHRAFFGLMPESISHEGYAKRPVHAYWDDFWTLRGLKDAVILAEALEDRSRAERYARLRDDFRRDLYASIRRVVAENHLDVLPASVELADFDPSATAIAVSLAGEARALPDALLRNTFAKYLAHLHDRRDGGVVLAAYTPYELRIVEALVRLGNRTAALELLDTMLAGQRPAAWKQWPEIVWRDPAAGKFIGDLPHSWIGAEYIRALRSLFVYEDEERAALVLAAGVPGAWLAGTEGIGVEGAPTWYGAVSYRLRRTGPREFRCSLSGALAVPAGGIVLRPPVNRPLRSVTVNGRSSPEFTGDQAFIRELPAEVVLRD